MGARRRLADLSRPDFAGRFSPRELERERADAQATIERRSAEIRQLGGDPDDPRLQ